MDRKKLESALAKPLPEADQIVHLGVFDPWHDVIEGIYGSYSGASDSLMINALEAARDHRTFDFIDETGFAGEFALYVLAGHGLLEYGTSPRGGWPDPVYQDLFPPLIAKWRDYYEIVWGQSFKNFKPDDT